MYISGIPPNRKFNTIDIREKSEGTEDKIDVSSLQQLFKLPDIISLLGVEGRTWKYTSERVNSSLFPSLFLNSAGKVSRLLKDNIRILIFNGD